MELYGNGIQIVNGIEIVNGIQILTNEVSDYYPSTYKQPALGKKIRSHHPGNPLGMYWKRINTFPCAYPIDSQVVGMHVFVQCSNSYHSVVFWNFRS